MQTTISMSTAGSRKYLVLIVIFVMSLSFRLWLLEKRWINPDEGAHLMDGALMLQGSIPGVHYDSRQPLYVLATAGTLKAFGVNMHSGRLLPLVCSMVTGVLIFAMAKRLFNVRAAILSAAMYWTFPLELFNSVVVKTQPLVITLTSLSLYALILHWKRGIGSWLVVSGVFAALAFYVRESALVIPLTVLLSLIAIYGNRIRKTAAGFALFMAGYAAVFVVALACYATHLEIGSLAQSSLSPLGILCWAAGEVAHYLGFSLEGGPAAFAAETFQSYSSWDTYYHYAVQALKMHLFLLAGLVFSLGGVARHLLSHRKKGIDREYVISHVIVYLWFFSLLAAYGFFFFTRGFFIDYSREFLPPLAIIFSAWALTAFPALTGDKSFARVLTGVMLLALALFLIQAHHKESFGIGHHTTLAVASFTLLSFTGTFRSLRRRILFASLFLIIIALIPASRTPPLNLYFAGTLPSIGMLCTIYAAAWIFLEKGTPGPSGRYFQFLARSIVAGLFVASITYSATVLGVAYDAIWSPQSLQRATEYIRAHTQPGDQVISGGLIWEFQAQRIPFQMISHPLAFEYYMPEEEALEIQLAASHSPPKVIILDGYTEKTYVRHIPWFSDFIQSLYTLALTVEPAAYPVKIYRLKRITLPDLAPLGHALTTSVAGE